MSDVLSHVKSMTLSCPTPFCIQSFSFRKIRVWWQRKFVQFKTAGCASSRVPACLCCLLKPARPETRSATWYFLPFVGKGEMSFR